MISHITQEELKSLFDYRDGGLYWIEKPAAHVDISNQAGCINARDYRVIRVNDRLYYAHRLIYLFHHGYLPKNVDHIDNIKLHNEVKNLREADKTQNGYNSKIPKSNTSGIKGVSMDKRSNLWAAYIDVKGKRKALGSFWDKEVAGQIVKIARLKYHGEFANHGY